MCKSANEPGGPYRCPGDMQKNLDTARQQLVDASHEEMVAEGALEYALDQQEQADNADDGDALDEMQEQLQDDADEVEGTEDFGTAKDKADKITSETGWITAVEQVSTYDPDNDADGERQYDSHEHRVLVFRDEDELREHMEGRYDADQWDTDRDGDGKRRGTAYGLNSTDQDLSTGAMEDRTLHVVEPEDGQQRSTPTRSGASDDVQAQRDQAKHKVDAERAHLERAQAATAVARKKVDKAQRDLDATPRQLGELQAEYDACEASGDRTTATHLVERIGAAQKRIDSDERERREAAAARGESPRPVYSYTGMGTYDDEPGMSDMNNLASSSQVSGVVREERDGDAVKSRQVTLTRSDDQGQRHSVKFPYDGPGTPTTGQALESELQNASRVEASNGGYEAWASSGEPSDRAEFNRHRARAEHLKEFLGNEAYQQQMGERVAGRV